MNFLIKIASISCEKAAFLGSKASFDALSFVERLKLKLHLKICTCETCHSYAKDSILIDEAVVKILEQKKEQGLSLSEEQRKKILEALK